jgi:hypothetical protein
MNQHAQAQLRSVTATVNYVKRVGEPLYMYSAMEPPPGKEKTNHVSEPHVVQIENLRDLAEPTRLDVQGFELVSFDPGVEDIYDSQQRIRQFDPAVVELIKRHTGAVEVRVCDAFLRGEEAQRRAPGTITAPAGQVHVDYTEDSGPEFFEKLLGADAAKYRGHRFAVINVWCPITGPLKDHPLALCDARTVDIADDLMVSKAYSSVGKDGLRMAGGEPSIGEVFYTAHNPKHRWYYAPDMRTDEALLLKNYDSATDGVARFSPHCAFKDPTAPADVLPRASIEVRVLTVW